LILIDDHPLVRDGLRARLEAVRNIEIVGEAGNAQEALALAASQEPHLVLMDVGMNGMNGIALAGMFHERFPAIRVLMLSMHDNLEYVTQAVRAGASGYVLKDSPATEIIQAIGAVLEGRTFFSAGLGARLIQASASNRPLNGSRRASAIFSMRSRKVSRASRSLNAIDLSVRTVETHRLNLKRKLDIEGQAELIKFAVEKST
jgi:Response regulator containing a CheY-like receiver domain and an HTH DNA-binding domain